MIRYVLRESNHPAAPTHEVVRVLNGFGFTIAWFYQEADAQEYVNWLNAKATAVGEKEITK